MSRHVRVEILTATCRGILYKRLWYLDKEPCKNIQLPMSLKYFDANFWFL